MSLLELEGVGKRYGTATALQGIDLAVAAGGRTAVVGPSGSGKSTLLRLIAGFEAPDAGRIRLDGRLLADGPRALPAHRRGIGIVSQDGALFPHLSVADNIGFGLDRGDRDRERRIAALAKMVELDAAVLRRQPHELSGGQQQRVALARALARGPRLMLLDEPFSALDTGLRAGLRKAVADLLGAAGIATLLVTHDQEEALAFADQLAVLRDGRLAQCGTPREIFLRPADAMVAAFLGDAVVVEAQFAAGWATCSLGRVRIADAGATGRGRIVLRPGQIALLPFVAEDGDGQVSARVVAVEFGGSLCRLSLGIDGAPGTSAGPDIAFRLAVDHPPAPGDRVRLSLKGEAHVLDAAP